MNSYPILIVLMISASLASATALQGMIREDGKIVVSMDDSGVLRELTGNAWSVRGTPCPGSAPFSLYIWRSNAEDDQYMFLAFDSWGYTYQFSSDRWLQIKEPPTAADPPCITRVWEVPGKSVNAFMLDVNGTVFITDDTGDRTDLFQNFPAPPALDMVLYYNLERETLYPLVLGSNGSIYRWQPEGWEATDLTAPGTDLVQFDLHVNQDTGTFFITGISDDGTLYSNIDSEDLTPLEHESCPGNGPWTIDLVPVSSGQLELLCIDSSGSFYTSRTGLWVETAPPFQAQ